MLHPEGISNWDNYLVVRQNHEDAKLANDIREEMIYQMAKKVFAFAGVALFILCLWMLR